MCLPHLPFINGVHFQSVNRRAGALVPPLAVCQVDESRCAVNQITARQLSVQLPESGEAILLPARRQYGRSTSLAGIQALRKLRAVIQDSGDYPVSGFFVKIRPVKSFEKFYFDLFFRKMRKAGQSHFACCVKHAAAHHHSFFTRAGDHHGAKQMLNLIGCIVHWGTPVKAFSIRVTSKSSAQRLRYVQSKSVFASIRFCASFKCNSD